MHLTREARARIRAGSGGGAIQTACGRGIRLFFEGELAPSGVQVYFPELFPIQDSDHEKLYSYIRFLLNKLPRKIDSVLFSL